MVKAAQQSGGTDITAVHSLGTDLSLRHGHWRLARGGHVLWFGHSRLQIVVELSCVGWGAALVRVGENVFSLFVDGRTSPAGPIVYGGWPTLPVAQVAEGSYQVLNYGISRQGESLYITNLASGARILLSSVDDSLVFEMPSRPPVALDDLLKGMSMAPAALRAAQDPGSAPRRRSAALEELMEWFQATGVRLRAQRLSSPAISRAFDDYQTQVKALSDSPVEVEERLRELQTELQASVNERRQLGQYLCSVESRLARLEAKQPEAFAYARLLFEKAKAKADAGRALDQQELREVEQRLEQVLVPVPVTVAPVAALDTAVEAPSAEALNVTTFKVCTKRGQLLKFVVPCALNTNERDAIEYLAIHGEVNASELRNRVTRRAPQMMASLQSRFQSLGVPYFKITNRPDGDLYNFLYEELP